MADVFVCNLDMVGSEVESAVLKVWHLVVFNLFNLSDDCRMMYAIIIIESVKSV